MEIPTYYVYIMSSLSRTLYTGVTNNLERRVFEHKQAQPGSFTVRYNVNRLAYFEEFGDINQAITREKRLSWKSSHLEVGIRVAHEVHRFWEHSKYPACGLVDNAPALRSSVCQA